jgi:RNA recognition motif-containing protein
MKFRIANVPSEATEVDIRKLFSGFGKVLSVALLPGPLHSKQLGSGLIELDNLKDADQFPDRCLFRGTVIRITHAYSAAENGTSGNAAALADPASEAPARPDNRSLNTLHVLSIEEVIDTATGKPNGWCRYSIKSFAGSITGLRRGNVADVTLYAEEAAEAFNMRNRLGYRKPTTWTSRDKK